MLICAQTRAMRRERRRVLTTPRWLAVTGRFDTLPLESRDFHFFIKIWKATLNPLLLVHVIAYKFACTQTSNLVKRGSLPHQSYLSNSHFRPQYVLIFPPLPLIYSSAKNRNINPMFFTMQLVASITARITKSVSTISSNLTKYLSTMKNHSIIPLVHVISLASNEYCCKSNKGTVYRASLIKETDLQDNG